MGLGLGVPISSVTEACEITPDGCQALAGALHGRRMRRPEATDGVGTPDPNLRNLVIYIYRRVYVCRAS